MPEDQEPLSYANYPQSIAEIRSDRSRQGTDWTPRDVLIATLRDLDSGRIAPHTLVVSWIEPGTAPGVEIHSFCCASPQNSLVLGALAYTVHKLARGKEM